MDAAAKRAVRLAAVVALLFQLLHGASAYRCIHSGMCSRGRLKPYTGDISSSTGLQQAAAARSHNKEIVLIMVQPNRILDARLFIGNLARLGMEHVLVLGDVKETCDVMAPLLPHMGCAWDGASVPDLSTLQRSWHIRYRTLARLVRMSYNVLMTDTDTVWFDDPYRFFKAPPLSNFTVINQAETTADGLHPASNIKPVGGLIYVQNARPDGVAAWLLAEVTDRYLRWAEDGFRFVGAKGVTASACAVDQDCLRDALSSVALGTIQAQHTIANHMGGTGGVAHVLQLAKTVTDRVYATFQTASLPLPKFMQDTAGSQPNVTVKYLPMVMPHTAGQWPEEWGGKWYPDKRGALSSAFQELLKNDCDNCPMWPDVEDLATLTDARLLPQEHYLLAPPWLMGSYHARGSTGMWLPDSDGRIPQVIGHVHYLPHASGTVGQLVARQLLDRYDWPLAEQHWGSQYVYLANMQQLQFGDSTPFIEDQPKLPRLLVLHPRLRLHKLQNLDEFITVVKGAMQIAELSNRTLVWPDMPCNTSWIGTVDPVTGLFSSHSNGLWYPHGEQRSAMRCTFVPLMASECLVQHQGMLPFEYEHLVSRFGVEVDLEAGRGNAIFVPAQGELHTSLDTARDPASALVEVARHDALDHLLAFDRPPVLYLAHPVQVADNVTRRLPTRLSSCLRHGTLDSIRVAAGPTWDAGATTASPRQPLRGQLVNGRLSVEKGMAGAPPPPPGITGNFLPLGSIIVQPFSRGNMREASASTWVGRSVPSAAGGVGGEDGAPAAVQDLAQLGEADKQQADVDAELASALAQRIGGQLHPPHPPLPPGTEVLSSATVIGSFRPWTQEPRQEGQPAG